MKNKAVWVTVERLATCNRCGNSQLAWVVSKRTGKPYLANAYRNGDEITANRIAFHKCPKVTA
jgi:hypothetical protein